MRFVWFGAIGVAAVAVALAVISLMFALATRGFIYTNLSDVPPAQTALILGAGVLDSGALSPVLQDRADAAVRLYQAGKVQKILVSGDNSTVSHNEVNPVRNYLLASGIPASDIFLDHAGFDTYSSMYRARDIFQVQSIIIVSESFHLPRAVYLAHGLGLAATAFSADKGTYLEWNYVREWFADPKALFDLLINRTPKYLGPTIPITGDGSQYN